MRLTTPHGISSPPFRFQGELCLWLLKKCYPCLRYTCYLCLQSIQRATKGGFGSVLTALLILSGPAVAFAASGDNAFTPTNIFVPFSTPAHAIYQNASLVLTICAAIFLVVGGLLAYSIFRFRRRPEHENLEPPQVYGSNQIELAWTVIPILIVIV